MPQSHKMLGQAAPAAATDTRLYQAPALTVAIVSSIHVCNTGAADDSIRIFAVPAPGGAGAVGNALYYDLVVPVGNPLVINSVFTLNAQDDLRVRSVNGNVTFTASGLEIT